ncbi:DsbA family protein [Endozoicomonadaceae bacterium StTr2]
MKKLLLSVLAAFGLGVLLTMAVDTVLDAAEPAEEQPLFEFDGKNLTRHDLPPGYAEAWFGIEKQAYEHKKTVIGHAVRDMYLEKIMAEHGLDRQEALAKAMPQAEVTEEEMQRFYEQNKEQIQAPYESVKPRIQQYLMKSRSQEAEQLLLEKLKTEQIYQIKLAPPVSPLNLIDVAGFPAKGSDDPVLTLVKFADYQCPHCGVAARTMDKLVEKYSDKIRLVYMDFPINRSGISRNVALAGVCADEQQLFWPFNKLAFEQQAELTEASPRELAAAIGTNMEQFDQCMASARPEEKLSRSEAEAERLGLTYTPTLFLNGQRLETTDLEQGLVTAIEERLQ